MSNARLRADDRVNVERETHPSFSSRGDRKRFARVWFSIERGGHFIRVDDAENSGSDSGRLSETEVRFNWTDSDGDISDFKCKLIDLSTVHDNRA